jgi:SAM-dependent methyltransferase
MEAIRFDSVADVYDCYVKTDFDIPFFLQETDGFLGEILELMCGTGRVSVPLLEAGRRMTCVDFSVGMLEVFRRKVSHRDFPVRLIRMDVAQLHLDTIYDLILLPFHSFSEILSSDMQIKALGSISRHLSPDGRFILTLQNPGSRLRFADGTTRELGVFPLQDGRMMMVSCCNCYHESERLVSGEQYYEIYNASGILTEKRSLEVHFKPVSDTEFRAMATLAGLEVETMYGDYSYGSFDERTSDYMVYKLRRVHAPGF